MTTTTINPTTTTTTNPFIDDFCGVSGRYVTIRGRCFRGTDPRVWRSFAYPADDMVGLSWVNNAKPSDADQQEVYFAPDRFSGSDYVGSLVEKANYEALLNIAEEEGFTLVETHGAYGAYGLLIPCFVETPREILEALYATENYPILDDDGHSRLEMEAQDDAWEYWACDQFAYKLEERFPHREVEIENLRDDPTSLYYLFTDAARRANVYWENQTGSDMYIDMDRILKAVDDADFEFDE